MKKIKDMKFLFTLPKGSKIDLENKGYTFHLFNKNKYDQLYEHYGVFVHKGHVYYSERSIPTFYYEFLAGNDDPFAENDDPFAKNDYVEDLLYNGRYKFINLGGIQTRDINSSVHRLPPAPHKHQKGKGVVGSLLSGVKTIIEYNLDEEGYYVKLERELKEEEQIKLKALQEKQKALQKWSSSYFDSQNYEDNYEYFVRYMLQFLLYDCYQQKRIPENTSEISINVEGNSDYEYTHPVSKEFFWPVRVEDRPWYMLKKPEVPELTPEEKKRQEEARLRWEKEPEEKRQRKLAIESAFNDGYADLTPQKKIERILKFLFEGKFERKDALDRAEKALPNGSDQSAFLKAFELVDYAIEKKKTDNATIKICAQKILSPSIAKNMDFSEVSPVKVDIDPMKYMDGKTKLFGQSHDDKIMIAYGELQNYAALLTEARTTIKNNLSHCHSQLKSWREEIHNLEEVEKDEGYQKKSFFDLSTIKEKKNRLAEIRQQQERNEREIERSRMKLALYCKEHRMLEEKYNKAAQKLCSVTGTNDFKPLNPFTNETLSVIDFLCSKKKDYRRAADMFGIYFPFDFI